MFTCMSATWHQYWRAHVQCGESQNHSNCILTTEEDKDILRNGCRTSSRMQDVRKTGRGLPAAVVSLASASVSSLRITPLHMSTTPSIFGRTSPWFLTMAAKFFYHFARLKEKGWNIYYIQPKQSKFATVKLLNHRKIYLIEIINLYYLFV